MSKKATLVDVSTGYTSGATLDDNFTALNDKFDNTLSLDGSTPNSMNADLDMNSNDILNTSSLYASSIYLNGSLLSPTTVTTTLGRWIETVGTLETNTALSYTGTGDNLIAEGETVSTRDGHYYVTAASGATDHHIQNSNGTPVKFYVNMNYYDLKAESFGCKFTGLDIDATDNATQMNKAVDYLRTEGQGGRIQLGSDGHLKINSPIIYRDDVIIEGKGSHVENIKASEDSAGDQSTACFYMGAFARLDSDDFTFYAASAATKHAEHITVSNPGDFLVGDTIYIVEANASFGDGTTALPDFAQINMVTGISGNDLALAKSLRAGVGAGSGTIGSSATGLWVANTSYRVNSALSSGLLTGRHIVKNIELHDVRLSTAFGEWMGRSGVYNGLMTNLEVLDSPYGFFGNGFESTLVDGLKGTFYTRGIETKLASGDFLLKNFNLRFSDQVSDTSDAPESTISFGELSQGVTIKDGFIDLGESNPGTMVQSVENWDATLENVTFRGKEVDLFLSTGSDASGTKFHNNKFLLDSTSNAISVSDGVDVEITDNTFTGTHSGILIRTGADGGVISGNKFANDADITLQSGILNLPQIYNNKGIGTFTTGANRQTITAFGNTGSNTALIKAQLVDESTSTGTPVNSTSEVIIGTVPVLPAGSLEIGDTIVLSYYGQCTGTNDTRTLRFAVCVDDDDDGASLDAGDNRDVIIDQDMPSTVGDWSLEVEITIQTTTTYTAKARLIELESGGSSNVVGDVVRHTSADFGDHPMRLEFSGLVANASDAIVTRSYRRSFERFGTA